jgi:sulfate adenylyltransferase large subunit/thioredoxin-dependent adenylylsulfate APS reductase
MNVVLKEPQQAFSLANRMLIRIVIVGHVDHGKSTLIGRLLHETGSLPEGKLEALKAASERRGVGFEWAFLLDALQTERDQGITIDTSQIRFRTETHDFVLIDAPRHTEFLRNMITGAAQADAAILIVDAGEGVREQTRRHGYLLHLLGLRQVAVVINKMDRVDYDAGRYHSLRAEIQSYLEGVGLKPRAVIPISARHGDGIATHSDGAAWYDGPTVLAALDSFSPTPALRDLALRLPVQAVYKFDDRRIIAGRIESGRIAVGDDIVVMPSGKQARVNSIEAWPSGIETPGRQSAVAGQSVGITLDRELFVDRGNLISLESSPSATCRALRARIFWLHQAPLERGSRVLVRIGTGESNAVIRVIDCTVDPGQIAPLTSGVIAQNHVGEIEISLARPLAADPYAANPATGRVVLEYGGRIAGGGLVLAVDQSAEPLASLRREAFRSSVAPSALGGRQSFEELATRLATQASEQTAAERLQLLRREIVGRIVLTTSFGLEDQVITHLLWQHGIDVDLVTLDTGRLFEETYEVWVETERRYGIRVRALYPRRGDIEDLVVRDGINGFYGSQAARLACCQIRKVEPLERALADAQAWITGLRSEQSAHRRDMTLVSADPSRHLIKFNPLFDWQRTQVLEFVADHNVPVNSLHAKGFASIGCAPCTRAISPGEPERAGRWWWEEEGKKECGLHSQARSA